MGSSVRGTSTKRPSDADASAASVNGAGKSLSGKSPGEARIEPKRARRTAVRKGNGQAKAPAGPARFEKTKDLPVKGGSDRYRRLPTGAHSLDPEEVRRDQRERLRSALIELIAERGYQAVRILDLTKLARVSRPTFYSLYTDKEELFLATFDEIAKRGGLSIAEAYKSQGSSAERLRAAMRAFAELAAAEPEAVSLLVLGAFGAGPKAFERRNRTLEAFEKGITAVRSPTPRGNAAKSRSRQANFEDDLTVRMILGGIREVTAARLRQRRADELPELTTDMWRWAACYPVKLPAGLEPPPAARRRAKPSGSSERLEEWDDADRRSSDRALQAEGRLPSGRHDLPRHFIVKNQRERIVDATAEIVAERGLAALTIPEIARRANVSHQTFYEMYPTKQDAFLGAQKVGLHQALGIAVEAYEAYTDDWPRGVAAGLTALLDYLASEPAHSHLTIVDTFAASPLAIEIRDTGLHAFASYLQPGFHFPTGRKAPEIAPEAIAGGIWQILHHYVEHDRFDELRNAGPQLSYLVLTPFLGPKEAARVARKSKTAAARR